MTNLVSAVRYLDTKTKERISELRVHEDQVNNVGTASEWTKTKVINSIESGNTFYTIYKGNDGKYQRGAEINVITVEEKKFLRTDANKIKEDNLGELPEF